MADGGRLSLCIGWDGQKVRQVAIASTRPQASVLLQDQTAQGAEQTARLLFNICGHAQGAAAALAIAAAQDRAHPARAELQLAVACEALQEHLWRLLLDWPLLLGLSKAEKDFVRWYGMLRGIVAGQSDLRIVRQEFEHRWLGMTAAEWLSCSSLDALQLWWRAGSSPAARLLAALEQMDRASVPTNAWLPDWSAEQASLATADQRGVDFALQPHDGGVPAETGALSYYTDTPLLRDVLLQRPSRLLARLLARILDMLDIVGDGGLARLDSTRTADGEGLAVVRTARGLLLHRVQLLEERVVYYQIVAPTEWNFHPQGVLVQGLVGMQVDDADQLKCLAAVQVLSLNLAQSRSRRI